MKETKEIQRVCGFYVSNVHFVTMILPYVSKQLNLESKFCTFLEFNLKENMELILSKFTAGDDTKENILNIKWHVSNIYKYANVEKELKNKLETKELNIFVAGNNKYIETAHESINKFLNNNAKKIQGKTINIIDCYEVSQFNDNIRHILDSHDSIINTSGIHKIEEVFEGYKRRQTSGDSSKLVTEVLQGEKNA